MRPKLTSMFNYLVPLGLQSIVISLSVCSHYSKIARLIVTKFFVDVACGCGSVLLWRCCDTYYIYKFCG